MRIGKKNTLCIQPFPKTAGANPNSPNPIPSYAQTYVKKFNCFSNNYAGWKFSFPGRRKMFRMRNEKSLSLTKKSDGSVFC